MKILKAIIAVAVIGTMLSACDNNRNNAKIGNTKDTGSVTKAGGPKITDTATITQMRKDSAKGGDTSAKGNVKPTGRP